MKFNLLSNKENKKEKKVSNFKKFFLGTTMLLASCGVESNINDHSKWEKEDTEISDVEEVEKDRKTYCDSSLLHTPFSSNISLNENDSIHLFNRTKITFEGKSNSSFRFYVEPENSKSYYLEIQKITNIESDNLSVFLEVCSYDLKNNIINLASDKSFLDFIFKGERTKIIEKNEGEYEQLIEKVYISIEGNSKVDELLYSEKNWIFPSLKNNESNTIIWFNDYPYTFNNTYEDLIHFFEYDSYVPLMVEGTNFLYDSETTITLTSIIEDKGVNYFVFDLENNDLTKRIIFPEKIFYTFDFNEKNMTFFVERKSSLGVTFYSVKEFYDVTYEGNNIQINVNGIDTNADVNFTHWNNLTKIEMYPKYNLKELTERKREE